MDGQDLVHRLRRLRRSVLMLQTELRHRHLDEQLINEIEEQMENGLASDPRSARLCAVVDALRESTLTPRAELYADTVRACEKLKDAIEDILSRAA